MALYKLTSSMSWVLYTMFNTDAREASEYVEAHILLAKGVKRDEKGERKIPFGVHLPSLLHCVVYDGNTVSIVEESEFKQILHNKY